MRGAQNYHVFLFLIRIFNLSVSDNTGTSTMFSLLSWILMCAAFCIRSSTSSNAGILIILLFYIQIHCQYKTKQRRTLSLRALIFPSGVSDPLVSLTCNETVEVVAGKPLTLNCTIQLLEEHCHGDEFVWEDSNNNIICDNTKDRTVNYTCEWDSKTYVSLLIGNVTESQSYTVQILTDCGSHNMSTIKVQQIRPEGE